MSLGRGLMWLTLAVMVTLGVAGYVAWSQHGEAGLKAAAIAAVVCWISGGLALYAMIWWKQLNLPLQGAFSAIGIRTFIPLGAATVLTARGGELAEAGVFGLIVVFYLVTLVVDTLISVKLVSTTSKVTNPPNANPG